MSCSVKRTVEVLRVDRHGLRRAPDEVAVEHPLTVSVADVEVATLLCSPSHVEDLVVGFLFSEGFIGGPEEVVSLHHDPDAARVAVELEGPLPSARRVVTSGCGARGTLRAEGLPRRVEAELVVGVSELVEAMTELHRSGRLFEATGAVHSAGLARGGRVLLVREDVGRHNAVDKVVGAALRSGLEPGQLVLLSSGRLSSEMVLKAARLGAPVVASRAAPTDLAVELAERLGVTLIGFLRGLKMNLYANPERIRGEK